MAIGIIGRHLWDILEQYGQSERFKNFFWDQKVGLLAYTLKNNELFVRINQ
jgi:hypothetical protein